MAGYIGTQPVPQATQSRDSFTATANQTTFATAGYQPGYIDVYLNGVHLVDVTDYTATNGSDVVLASGASVNDIVEVVAYSTFEVLNQTLTGTTTVDVLNVTGAFTSLGIDDNATSTAITLSSGGNVGIGTSSVSDPLHIKADRAIIRLEPTTVGGTTYRIRNGISGGSEGGLSFYDVTNAATRLAIDSSGNVGIGTGSPDRVLHLNNSGTEQNVRAKFTNGTTGEGASDGFEIGINASNPAEVVLVNYEASPMAFFTSGSERLRIDSSGNVLVGSYGFYC